MWCIPFANFHFQMGVTVMGFAEDFGPGLLIDNGEYKHQIKISKSCATLR